MRKVDYAYIVLLTVITILLLLLVLKPDPNSHQGKQYSEAICVKMAEYALEDVSAQLDEKFKDGWVLVMGSGLGGALCFAR